MPRYEDIEVGDSASFGKTVSESDIYTFAGVTGDLNPAHIDEEYAKKTMFKGRIAHGMLGAGFISAVLGTRLPGPGTIYLSQELRFKAPVRIGDTVTATCKVTDKDDSKRKLTIETVAVNQDGKVIIDGAAVVMLPAEAG
jgi:3-hydroxybutyryl-CoA dehydratase